MALSLLEYMLWEVLSDDGLEDARAERLAKEAAEKVLEWMNQDT